MNRSEILRALAAEPWAITPTALDRLISGVESLNESVITGPLFADHPEAAARAAVALAPSRQSGGSIAVVPVSGMIVRRASLFTMIFGGTPTDALVSTIRGLVADDSVSGIVLSVDSPGGTVDGLSEAANEIFRMRGSKPIVTLADTLAASAAYWLGSQADELVVTPSGFVGSIGVYTVHSDVSKSLEMEGIDVTLISAGKYKTEGNPYEPLTDEARAAIQSRVDNIYADFVAAVARGRDVRPSDVRNGFGEGRVVGAKEAVRLGMADRIGTLGDAVARAGARPKGPKAEAAEELIEATAEKLTAVVSYRETDQEASEVAERFAEAGLLDSELDLRRRRARRFGA